MAPEIPNTFGCHQGESKRWNGGGVTRERRQGQRARRRKRRALGC